MGETSLYCHPSPEGCCLELHETILILVALIVLVQLALKLAAVICYYLWYLLASLFEMVFAKAPRQARGSTATPRPRRARSRRPSEQWSQQDIPRHRRRSESPSPRRRCLHCTLEPLQLTMDLQSDEPCPFREHARPTRRHHHDYPPYSAPPSRYYNCECEWRPRPRPVSAPSGHRVTRYRDVGCGSSDPLLKPGSSATERRTATPGAGGSDPFPRTPVGETHYRTPGPGQDTDFPAASGLSRTRRPAKVYIYPVHPQTPPGSRSVSPERSVRRRTPGLPAPEELTEFDPREQRRKPRDAEQQLGLSTPLPRFHSLGTSTVQGGTPQTEAKQRFYWTEPLTSTPAQDWVYRPLK